MHADQIYFVHFFHSENFPIIFFFLFEGKQADKQIDNKRVSPMPNIRLRDGKAQQNMNSEEYEGSKRRNKKNLKSSTLFHFSVLSYFLFSYSHFWAQLYKETMYSPNNQQLFFLFPNKRKARKTSLVKFFARNKRQINFVEPKKKKEKNWKTLKELFL